MKVSFDGARLNLARSFNELVKEMKFEDGRLLETLADQLSSLRLDIGLLLCIYDDKMEGDFNSLADTELTKIP